MLRQGDADVFKLYRQAKLGMMHEALTKLNRRANEQRISSTERAHSPIPREVERNPNGLILKGLIGRAAGI